MSGLVVGARYEAVNDGGFPISFTAARATVEPWGVRDGRETVRVFKRVTVPGARVPGQPTDTEDHPEVVFADSIQKAASVESLLDLIEATAGNLRDCLSRIADGQVIRIDAGDLIGRLRFFESHNGVDDSSENGIDSGATVEKVEKPGRDRGGSSHFRGDEDRLVENDLHECPPASRGEGGSSSTTSSVGGNGAVSQDASPARPGKPTDKVRDWNLYLMGFTQAVKGTSRGEERSHCRCSWCIGVHDGLAIKEARGL